MTRIASLDFGPVHTSLCIATVQEQTLLSIDSWMLLTWRDFLTASSEVNQPASAPHPPPSLAKSLSSLKKQELWEELLYWETDTPSSSSLSTATRPILLAKVRDHRRKKRPNIRKTFYSSYDKYISVICQHLQLNEPWDIVLLEHQAANFRYENIVIESMVSQHIYTYHSSKGWPSPQFHFVPGSFKFRPFIGSDPKPQIAARTKRQKTVQHDLNKAYAESKCVELLQERGFTTWIQWIQEKQHRGEKCDDLADAYLQLEAFLRVPPGKKPPVKPKNQTRKTKRTKERKTKKN
jgi:hypothetical protein